jgi:hypothetical protein
LADNYGGRGYGWFKPPQTGNYIFILIADDTARLFPSTDDNPANKKAIAAEATWSDQRQWTSATDEQRSDTYPQTAWDTGGTITLQKDRVYYLEALWQEGSGGDGAEVTYILAGQKAPANGTASALAGENIGIYVDPGTLAPVITQHPQYAAVAFGGTAIFTVSAFGRTPFNYQWRHSVVDIPGATDASLTIANAGPTNSGAYAVVVTNSKGSAASQVANLDVIGLPIPAELRSIARTSDGQVRIDYSGVLQSADSVTGPYADVPGASAPYSAIPFGTARFFRARGP